MFGWIREWLEIRAEFRERKHDTDTVCQSCETLKMQLAIANREKEKLLDRLLIVPEPVKEPEPSSEMQVSLPRAHLPFKVRRQMMEMRDREIAQANKLVAQAPKPESTDKLEKDINVSTERTGS